VNDPLLVGVLDRLANRHAEDLSEKVGLRPASQTAAAVAICVVICGRSYFPGHVARRDVFGCERLDCHGQPGHDVVRRVAEASCRTGWAKPVQLVIRVKELARAVGSYKSLQQLVDLLSE
jgi:hypothetical protein